VADVEPEEGELSVGFDGRSVTYGFGERDALVPAYAASTHKSQGSEYPAVVIKVVDSEDKHVRHAGASIPLRFGPRGHRGWRHGQVAVLPEILSYDAARCGNGLKRDSPPQEWRRIMSVLITGC
jgi:hypothetical protein